jgi:hypothetical protein
LTLPLVSYGGSSLVVSLFLVGILLNIGRRQPPRLGRKRELVNSSAVRRKRRAVIVCGS